jgi:alanine racemase
LSGLIRALIDVAALRANLAALRVAARGAKVMAVVKANAYGHGIAQVTAALELADAFAVARIEEAVALREAGVVRPIVLLEGVFTPGQLQAAAAADLELVVHDPEQLRLLEEHCGEHRFLVWFKVNTGMNRLGFRAEHCAAALERLRALRTPLRELRWLTHLASADDTASAMTATQVARFHEILRRLAGRGPAPVTSIGNSAGLLAWEEARGDWVRPGLALYGASPVPGRSAAEFGLRPVMSFETTVIAVRDVPRGETVGYGGGWLAVRDSRVAILAAGYADGVPRHLECGSPVRVAGVEAPVVGRVSMDMCAVDVTEVPGAVVGSPALLWGPGLPVEQMAARSGTIAYELFCGVGQRVQRLQR